MHIPMLLRRLARNRRGNVLILAALSLPVLVGSAGLAVDTMMWTLDKRQLQRSADSAALAGAFARGQSFNPVASATADLARTNQLTLSTPAVIETPPASSSYAGKPNAVRIALRTRRAMPFSSLFLSRAPDIAVSSTAAVISNGNFCVIALDTSNNTGVTATGSANVDLNCGIFANSGGGTAVSVGGSSQVRSTPVAAVGGIPASNNFVGGTTLMPYSLRQPDPFAGLPQPSLPSCSPKINVQPTETATVGPGCYRGMDIKGTVTFTPGVYYIEGSSVSFGSQAVASGSGVTFILTSAQAATNHGSIATLDMNGGAQLDLAAPSSGTYSGVLFYQDRRAETGTTNRINGNSASHLQGAFYFPRQNLDFNGNSGMTTDCVQFVGSRVTFSGNSTISNSCPLGPSASFRGSIVRIVE